MTSDSAVKTETKKIKELKRLAAVSAVDFIESGMSVGLGTGSTAEYALHEISRRLHEGAIRDMLFVPSSLKTEILAARLGIPLTPLEDVSALDINIDGADEVDAHLNLIKGGGGALLREKIVAQISERNIVIVDEGKLSDKLGTKYVLPIEVFPFAAKTSMAFVGALGANIELRKNEDGTVFRTDQNNYILDCNFGPIEDLKYLSEKLSARAGIVEHGLFLTTTSDLIIGTDKGCRHVKRKV